MEKGQEKGFGKRMSDVGETLALTRIDESARESKRVIGERRLWVTIEVEEWGDKRDVWIFMRDDRWKEWEALHFTIEGVEFLDGAGFGRLYRGEVWLNKSLMQKILGER